MYDRQDTRRTRRTRRARHQTTDTFTRHLSPSSPSTARPLHIPRPIAAGGYCTSRATGMHPLTGSYAIMPGHACQHGPFPGCACAKHKARSSLSHVTSASSTHDQSADDQRTEQGSIPRESALAERLAELQGAFWKDGGETSGPMDIIFEDPADADADADAAMDSGEETAVETDSDEDPNGLGPTLSRCDSRSTSTGTGARSKWQTEYRARRGSGLTEAATEAPGSELQSEDKENESGASEVGTEA
jgi:hypothetical protein